MEQLFKFVELTRKFRQVKRMVRFKDGAQENDVEHSFQLAITAWYLIEKDKLNLDVSKVLRYALSHDLVEAYAGDTPSAVHRNYEGDRATKKAREEEAALRIKNEFKEFADLHHHIEAYERREDEESKFVYALDKVMPVLNIYLDDGYSWKLNDVKIDDVIAYKRQQIAESHAVEKYFRQIIPLLNDLKAELDGKNGK